MSPVSCTIVVAIFVGAIAAFVPDAVLWDLTSMGTLVAFMVVSTGVMILRHTRPDMPRGFKGSILSVLPILSIVSCRLYLIYKLSPVVFQAVRNLAGVRRRLLPVLARGIRGSKKRRDGREVLVGYSADQGGREALALGILLARASAAALVVCTIVPETWGHPSMAPGRCRYAGFLDRCAKKTLDKARVQVSKLA